MTGNLGARTVARAHGARSGISAQRHGWSRLLAYALPNFSLHILIVPAASIVPTLYAKERGVALAAIGAILFAVRIFDGITDQLIGYCSDQTLARWGFGRKSWIATGAALVLPSIWFLFVPPADAGAFYFATWSFLLYLAWTMMAIPYTAWGAELSRGYDERTRIVTARMVVGEFGSLLFFAAPLILFHFGLVGSTELDLGVLQFVALALLVLLPATLVPALLHVPRGVVKSTTPPGLLATLRAVSGNRPLLIYLSAFLLSEIGYGVWATLVFLFVSSHLGLSASFSYIIIAAALATVVSMPLWNRVSRRLGKLRTWGLSWTLTGLSYLLLLTLPGDETALWQALAVISLTAFLNGAGLIVAPSVLGDIVDYDTLRTGAHRAGNYFALHALAVKLMVAIGGGIAFFVLGLFDYEVAAGAQNTPVAETGLLLMIAVVPAVFRLLAVGCLALFPLDARRQDIVRRRLEQREARATAA